MRCEPMIRCREQMFETSKANSQCVEVTRGSGELVHVNLLSGAVSV